MLAYFTIISWFLAKFQIIKEDYYESNTEIHALFLFTKCWLYLVNKFKLIITKEKDNIYKFNI